MPKISELPATVTPTGAIEIPGNDAGTTKKITITNLLSEINLAKANLASPALTGTPTAPTAAVATDSTQIATTAFVYDVFQNSPAMLGTPTVPTAAPGTSTTQAASTAFVTIADGLKLSTSGSLPMLGALDMGTNLINNVVDPVLAQSAATKNYVTNRENTTVRKLQNYDPTATSAFPITYDSAAIKAGAAYFITVAGTMAAGSVTVEIGDVIIARVDAATNASADWAVINTNVLAASTTVAGRVELATDAETQALASTTLAVTPSNLGALLATETQAGIREIATQAETDAGTSDITFITPLKLEAKASTDYRKFLGLRDVLNYSAGVWTLTRIAQGDYAQRKTAAAETTIIGIDITKEFRATSLRGFKLNSFDVIYRNTTAALVAHTITLDRISYTDSGVVTVTTVPLTGSLLLTTNANPRVTSIEVTTPIYAAGDKYIMELTVNAAATSVYDFIGIVLRFSQTLS